MNHLKNSVSWFLRLLLILAIVAACDKDAPVEPPFSFGEWESLGLPGKLVAELVLDGNYLYACACKDGLFRLNLTHTDTAWEYLGFADSTLFRTLEDGVTALNIHPHTGDLLIGMNTRRAAVPEEIGVFRSTDFGQTWAPSDAGLPRIPYNKSNDVSSLCSSPSSPDRLFIGTSTMLFRSEDRGNSWEHVLGEGGEIRMDALSVSYTEPGVVWTGGESGFFQPFAFHSTDYGLSWERIKSSDLYPLGDNAVYDIAISPIDHQMVYLSMLGLVMKTTNSGQTWQQVLGREDGVWRNWKLAIYPKDPQRLFFTGGYLYYSQNGGSDLEKITLPGGRLALYALVVDWGNKVLYVSTSSTNGNGIFKMNF